MNSRHINNHCCGGPRSGKSSERRERRNSTASPIHSSSSQSSSRSRHLPTMNLSNSYMNDQPLDYFSQSSASAASVIYGDPTKHVVFAPQPFPNSHPHAESFRFRGFPAELSAEFTARYEYSAKDEDLLSSGTLAKYYELLQSYESTNDLVLNTNVSENISEEPIHHQNTCCHMKCCNNTLTYAKDEISKYVHKVKNIQALKNEQKGPSNEGFLLLPTTTDFKSVEVQTDPVSQRNVTQQTCFPSLTDKIESDEIDINICHEPDNETNAHKKNIFQSMLIDCSDITLNDVVGLEEAKVVIKEIFILPLTHPHLFNSFPGYGKRCCRCLLYGPPGTGKTLLAKAIASELRANLYYVSCAGILSCFIGQSEKNIKELFEYVLGQTEPSIIFFDEIDSVCRKRYEDEPEHSRRFKTELLKYFEWPPIEHSQAYIISATNCPWDLDPAFLRRFQRQIYIPMPERSTRYQMMTKYLGDLNTILSEDDWNQILNETEGFSGSDLTNFMSIALAQPNREILCATHWKYFDGDHVIPCDPNVPDSFQASLNDIPPHQVLARCVELRDFLKATKDTPKTISRVHIKQFEKFKKHLL